MIRALAITVLAVLAASLIRSGTHAVAADDLRDALRPCTRGDLIGTWAMIRLGTAPSVRVDESDPYFYPYQRYAFSAGDSVGAADDHGDGRRQGAVAHAKGRCDGTGDRRLSDLASEGQRPEKLGPWAPG